MEENNILSIKDAVALLAKALKKDEQDVQEALEEANNGEIPTKKDDLLKAFSSIGSDRLKEIKEEGHNYGHRKAMKAAQKAVADHFEVDHSGKIEDVLGRVQQPTKEGEGGKPSLKIEDLTESQLAAHPAVKKIIGEKDGLTQKVQELETSLSYKDIEFDVRKQAFDIWQQMNPHLAEGDDNSHIRSNQIDMFYSNVLKHKYKKIDGKMVPVDENGEPLQKDFQPVTMSDIVKQSTPVTYGELPDKAKSPNPKQPGKGGAKKITLAKEEVNYKSFLEAQKRGDLEKAAAIKEAIYKQAEGGEAE